MAEEALIGDELKATLRMAARKPMAFAFNPGKPDDSPYFILHKLKAPDVLGRIAKSEGPGSKVAFGTCEVQGQVLSLTCLSELPGTAKRLKKFLKSQQIRYQVVALDASGALLEDDGDPQEAAEGTEAGAGTDTGSTAGEAEAAQTDGTAKTAEPGPDLRPLLLRAKDLKTRIAELPAASAEKLGAGLDMALKSLKAGDIPAATAGMDKIASVLDKLASGGGQGGEKPGGAGGDAAALVPRIKAAQAALALLAKPLADPLAPVLAGSIAALKEGKTELAAAALDKLEAGLAAAKSAAKAAEQTAPKPDPKLEQFRVALAELEKGIAKLEPSGGAAWLGQRHAALARALAEGEVEILGRGFVQLRDLSKLQGEIDALLDQVSSALSSGAVEDASTLRAAIAMAQKEVEGGDAARGAKILQRVKDLLAQGVGRSHADEVGADVQPFAISRVLWADTRKQLQTEIAKLEAAIRDACGDDDELKDVVAELGKLTANVQRLDARLEDKLDEIVGTTSGDKRQKLKAEATGLIADYHAELATPFFQEVDDQNGFVAVKIASSANAALARISKVLEA